MKHISAETIKKTAAASAKAIEAIEFNEFMKTLSALDDVYACLGLTEAYGKPNCAATLAFYLGMECAAISGEVE